MASWRHAAALLWPGHWTAADERGIERACHWFVPVGLLIGLIYAGVYRAAWRQFGEVVYGLRLIPATTVWLLDVAFFGLALYVGAASTVARVAEPARLLDVSGEKSVRDFPIQPMALVILLTLKLVLLVAIPTGTLGWPGGDDWRRHFNWMYPRPYYRPLILAPIWGRWAMLLVGSIGRCTEDENSPFARFCRSLTLGRVILWMLPAAVLTSIYCGRHGRWMLGCIISLVVLAMVYLYGVASARRLGGQNRDTIRGAGIVGEMTFLVAYEALAWRIYAS